MSSMVPLYTGYLENSVSVTRSASFSESASFAMATISVLGTQRSPTMTSSNLMADLMSSLSRSFRTPSSSHSSMRTSSSSSLMAVFSSSPMALVSLVNSQDTGERARIRPLNMLAVLMHHFSGLFLATDLGMISQNVRETSVITTMFTRLPKSPNSATNMTVATVLEAMLTTFTPIRLVVRNLS